MGLMDKIDAKLHKDKPSDQHKSNTYDNYDSNTTSSNDYTSSGTKDSKYGGSSTSDSNMYGSHPAVNRDGYGDDSYGSSNTHGSHGGVSDKLHSSSRSGEYPSEHSGSSRPHDPFSSKGQRAAAGDQYGSSSGGYGSGATGSTDYGRSSYDDPATSRSKHGGITNNPHDPTNDLSSSRHGHGNHGTSAPGYDSGASTGSSHLPGHSSGHHGTSSRGYDDSTGSSHNDGRDAGMAGAGAGAYETAKHHTPGMSSSYDQPQSGSHNYPDPTTASRSAGGPMGGSEYGQQQPMGGAGMTGSGMGGAGESGIDPARKMGGAYEAGYRDAMEHAKSEMQNQR